MSKLGVHALVWVGGWSEADCAKAIRSTAELGYDFIEIPLWNPYGFPVGFTRASRSTGSGPRRPWGCRRPPTSRARTPTRCAGARTC